MSNIEIFNQMVEFFNLLIENRTGMAHLKSTRGKSPVKKKSQVGAGSKTKARQALLKAAKGLFARKGLSATTIRDIAEQANLNSSMISYYFNGKEGLYKSCLEEIGSERLQMAERILQSPDSPDEYRIRLKMFCENLFELFLDDRDSGLIIVREYDRVDSPAEEIFKSTFLKVFDLIYSFFKNAQSRQLISKDKDPFTLAKLFFGCLSSQMRLDHVNEKIYKKSLKQDSEREKVLNHIIDLFLPGSQ